MDFTGLDARVMVAGVRVRGEFLHGQPWNGPSTNGWYAETIVHRPVHGPGDRGVPVRTARTTRQTCRSRGTTKDDYMTWEGQRQTVGGRIRLPGHFTAQVNLIRQSEELGEYGRTAFDVAVTKSIKPPLTGDRVAPAEAGAYRSRTTTRRAGQPRGRR
jgi:hypothetical protein